MYLYIFFVLFAGDWKFRRLKLYDCDRQKPFKVQCIRVLAEKSAKSPLLVQEHNHETTNEHQWQSTNIQYKKTMENTGKEQHPITFK